MSKNITILQVDLIGESTHMHKKKRRRERPQCSTDLQNHTKSEH